MDEKAIVEWLKKVSAPVVVDLADEQSESLISPAFEKGLPLLLFLVVDQSNQQTVVGHLKAFCKGRQEEMLCGYVSSESEIFQNVVEWLSLKSQETKKSRLLWVNTSSIDYVFYEDSLAELEEGEIKEFMEKVSEGDFKDDDDDEDEDDNDDDDDGKEEETGDDDDDEDEEDIEKIKAESNADIDDDL